MEFRVSCDAHWESRVDQVLDLLSDFGYDEYFRAKHYGVNVRGIYVVIVCQRNELALKKNSVFKG